MNDPSSISLVHTHSKRNLEVKKYRMKQKENEDVSQEISLKG
jgi:hypothetical protein